MLTQARVVETPGSSSGTAHSSQELIGIAVRWSLVVSMLKRVLLKQDVSDKMAAS